MSEQKDFDAVRMMREIRDRMSADMKELSYEEQVQYIEKRANPIREELRNRSAHKAA